MREIKEFDCLILGDEPAGFWFLDEFHKVQSSVGNAPPMGWLNLSSSLPKIPISKALAEPLGLRTSAPWTAELLSPHERFVWSQKELLERYPDLPISDLQSFDLSTAKYSSQLKLARQALGRHPELLSLSKAFWNYFGRSSNLQPETQVLNGLLLSELVWWQPIDQLPESTSRIPLNLDETADRSELTEIRFSKKGTISFHLPDQTLITQTLLINVRPQQLQSLVKRFPPLEKYLSEAPDLQTHGGVYPLSFRTSPNVLPPPAPPLFALCEDMNLPNANESLWVVESHRFSTECEITLWGRWPWGLSLESLSTHLKQGWKQLNWYLPFLSDHLKSVSLPPEGDSCSSKELRNAARLDLEQTAIPQFPVSRIQTETRSPSLFFISAASYSYLPYPFGTLLAARSVLERLLGRKKRTLKSRAKAMTGPVPPEATTSP